MASITQCINDQVVQAFVLTMFHTLWQFSVIALVMSFLLKKYHFTSSSSKYYIALGSLLLALLTGVGTFFYYLNDGSTNFSSFETELVVMSGAEVIEKHVDLAFYFYQCIGYIEQFQVPIFIAWLIGVAFFGIKFFGGFVYVEYISKSAKIIQHDGINRLCKSILGSWDSNSVMEIGESKHIDSPMIVGILKPLILFPIGVINQLEMTEIEAILAHELAHFVRKDIYVNVLQNMVEVLFYYHPAIWWISLNVRIERENCCDDLAIKHIGNHLLYAKTLVKVQEMSLHASPSLALGFSKKESYFSNRIKRILNMSQTRSYLKEKVLTSIIMIGLVMFFTKDVVGSHSPIDNMSTINSGPEMHEIMVVIGDSIPNQRESITIVKKTNDQDVKLSMENGKVTQLEVDGKKIPEEDFHLYEDIIADNQPKSMQSGNAQMFFFGNDGDMPFNMNFGRSLNIDSIFGSIDMDRLGMGQGRLEEQMKMLQDQLGKMNFDFNGLDSMGFDFRSFVMPDMQSEDFNNQMDLRFFDLGDTPSFFDMEGEYPDQRQEDMPNGDFGIEKPSSNFTEAIGNTLNRDGLLIPGQDNKVELTGKYLKINGEKQPSNIWHKYKRIFEEQSGSQLQKSSKLVFNIEGKVAKRKYKVY